MMPQKSTINPMSKMQTVCLVLLSAILTTATLFGGSRGFLLAFGAEFLSMFACVFWLVLAEAIKEEAHLGGLLK